MSSVARAESGFRIKPIVASGERSALPHGRATFKKIALGEFLTLDFGAVFQGYHSDMTRTVAVGKVRPEAKKIYAAVSAAQLAAIEAARGGVRAKDLDGIARGIIRKNGFEKFFRHSPAVLRSDGRRNE